MEKPYAPPADPHKIIKSIEWLDDEVVDAMTKQYVQKHKHTLMQTEEQQVLAFSSSYSGMKIATIFFPFLVLFLDFLFGFYCFCRILGAIPNTYAFTKSLSEALVVEQMSEMPAVIMRPSIVIPIRYEPIPGWTDNINGPTGLLIGAGKGVIRSMYCNSSSYGDYLPVDYAVNGIMVSSWNFVANK